MTVAKSLDKILFQDTDEHGDQGFLCEKRKRIRALREFRVQRVLHLDFEIAMALQKPEIDIYCLFI